MLIGKIKQIHADHAKWIAEIDVFQDEIQFLRKILLENEREDSNKLKIELDHNSRLLDKLRLTIRTHRTVLTEMATDDKASLEMLDEDGHLRNKKHLRNLEESFKVLKHHILDTYKSESARS
jgi:hypothetical protein